MGDSDEPSMHLVLRVMRYRAEVDHAEIDNLKIRDGLPIAAEVTTRKVTFSS